MAEDPVDIYTGGVDTYLGKKAYLTVYYSLSAGKGNVFSRPLGDPTITTGADAFLLTGTNAAASYPETVNRSHEVAVIFKYKITENLTPKIEYHYQQWDYKDYQTSPMTQYMGCVSPIPNGPPVSNSVPGCTTPVLTTNTVNACGELPARSILTSPWAIRRRPAICFSAWISLPTTHTPCWLHWNTASRSIAVQGGWTLSAVQFWFILNRSLRNSANGDGNLVWLLYQCGVNSSWYAIRSGGSVERRIYEKEKK